MGCLYIVSVFLHQPGKTVRVPIKILLVGNRTGWEKGHGVAGKKFKFGICGVAAKGRSQRMALYRVFRQRVDKRGDGNVGVRLVFKCLKICKGLTHDHYDVGFLFRQQDGILILHTNGIQIFGRVTIRLFDLHIMDAEVEIQRKSIEVRAAGTIAPDRYGISLLWHGPGSKAQENGNS